MSFRTASAPRGRAIALYFVGFCMVFIRPAVAAGTPAAASTAPAPPAQSHTSTGKNAGPSPVHQRALRLKEITVTAQFERARNELSPSTGSSQYRFDAHALQALPEGSNTPINQVLLQAPGVVNDAQGQLHVRGDHGDLQYRINGVILPEGISGFGNALDTHFAGSIRLLTGALPAQYGDRTAGVVDITTKEHFDGGQLDLYGGVHATFEPSVEYGQTFADGSSAFVSGSYLRSQLGTEAPTPAYNPIHDATEQGRGFGFLSLYPAHHLRLSLLAGTDYNFFQIPNTPGLAPNPQYLQYAGVSGFDSAKLDERQFERTQFAITALQGLLPHDGSWQTALFERISTVEFEPDPVGDLVFNGVAAKIKRKSRSYGVQSDLSLPLSASHTLRAGLVASGEDDRSDDRATVFPTDAQGNPNGPPVTIVDNNPKNGNTLLGVYLQDQWTLSDSVTVNYGLRYDRVDAFIHSDQLSPRLGLIWYATSSTTVHAGYARYFTPPPNELVANTSIAKFANTTNAPAVTQNDPVKAERDDYFDVGVSHDLTPQLNLGLDTYYKFARDLLDEGQFGQALIFTPFNYRLGHVYGAEFTASFRRGPLSAYLNLARSVARATQVVSGQFNFAPDELAYIDRHYVFLDHQQLLSGSGGISYRWRGTDFSLDAVYSDGLRRGFANTGKLPPYLVLDLGLHRRVHLGAAGPLELRLAVINLLDRSYAIRDGSGIGVGAAQYGERRGAYIGVSKSFGG